MFYNALTRSHACHAIVWAICYARGAKKQHANIWMWRALALKTAPGPAAGQAQLSQMSVYVNGFEISFSLAVVLSPKKRKECKASALCPVGQHVWTRN